MTSGQETEQVYSYNPGTCTGSSDDNYAVINCNSNQKIQQLQNLLSQ